MEEASSKRPGPPVGGLLAVLASAAWLAAAGCRAGPPPGEFPPPEAGAGAGQSGGGTWADSVDGAVFGSNEEAVRTRKARDRRPDRPTPASDGAKGDRAQAAVWTLKANQAILAGRLEEAESFLRAAIRAAPKGERRVAQRALADVLLALRRNDEAVRHYEMLIAGARGSDLVRLRANLAAAQLRRGETRLARLEAQRALALQPADPEALKTLGLIDLAEGDADAGREHLTRALSLRGDTPEAQAALAALDESSGNLRSALARYRKLLDSFEKHRSTDYHRRWRDLFYPEPGGTERNLRERIQRLEALSAFQGLGPEGERDR